MRRNWVPGSRAIAFLLAITIWATAHGLAAGAYLTIQQPKSGETVSGDVAIVLGTSKRVKSYAVSVDSQPLAKLGADGLPAHQITWHSGSASAGKHTILARAYSARNHSLSKRSIVVTVAATPTPARTATRSPTHTPTRTTSPTAKPTATPAGAVFYVAPTGSDSNSGVSRTSPWRTIQHAANSLLPGETAIVMAGNFAETVSMTRSGASGKPLTLEADSGATVVTKGFQVRADYVAVVGFQITNTATTEPAGYGVYLVGSYNRIASNYIHDLYFEGITLSGEGDPNSAATSYNNILSNTVVRAEMAGINIEGRYNLVAGNDVSATRQYPTGGPRRSGADADGMRFFGTGHVLRSNHIHDIAYGTTENPDPHIDCFQTWGPATSITIERNLCIWASTSEQTDNEASSLESIDGVSSQIIYRNNVFANMRQGINASDISGLSVLNNTWDDVLEEAVILDSSPATAIENNIFFNVGDGGDSYACIDSASKTGISIASNDHYMTQGSPGTYCSNAAFISKNPLFVNAGQMDFQLQSTSPLVNTGTTLSVVPNDYDGVVRPQGPAYDIGAFEYH